MGSGFTRGTTAPSARSCETSAPSHPFGGVAADDPLSRVSRDTLKFGALSPDLGTMPSRDLNAADFARVTRDLTDDELLSVPSEELTEAELDARDLLLPDEAAEAQRSEEAR